MGLRPGQGAQGRCVDRWSWAVLYAAMAGDCTPHVLNGTNETHSYATKSHFGHTLRIHPCGQKHLLCTSMNIGRARPLFETELDNGTEFGLQVRHQIPVRNAPTPRGRLGLWVGRSGIQNRMGCGHCPIVRAIHGDVHRCLSTASNG